MKNVIVCAALAAGVASSAMAANTTVFSNTPVTGDSYTYSSFISSWFGGQAVGASGWHYNNVRANATVGINTEYTRNGNGSVSFGLPSGAKADIEFFAAANVNSRGQATAVQGSSLGKLGALTALSYDWYRDSDSTVAAHFMPTIRLQVRNGTSTGYLVYEQVYNAGGSAITDAWVSMDVLGSNSRMWASQAWMPHNGEYYTSNINIENWIANYANWDVVGISLGVGSGWTGLFYGGIDNVTFGFNGNNTTYNFEVFGLNPVIPTPLAGLMGGAGLMLLGARRRR